MWGTLSGQAIWIYGCPHHAHCALACQPCVNLKICQLSKSLNEFSETSVTVDAQLKVRLSARVGVGGVSNMPRSFAVGDRR